MLKFEQEARSVMQTSHPLFSVFPRLPRPISNNDAAEYAEKRGILNRKREASCRHHTLFSASFRVFCGPLHANDAAEYAEKRGNRNRKRETSCRHHTLFSASFRVFCGQLHAMLPLKTLNFEHEGHNVVPAPHLPFCVFQRLLRHSTSKLTHSPICI